MTLPSELLYPAMKVCSRKDCELAGILQPVENFHLNKVLKSGRNSHCKICDNKYKLRWARKTRDADPEKWAAKSRSQSAKDRHRKSYRIWYARRRDELNAMTKAWRKANPEEVRRLHIIRRFRQYGITLDWYESTLAAQGGKCAICGSTDAKSNGKTFHVDHDHSCCKKSCFACDKCRRGLLCAVCNTRLGILENRTWVKQAEAYLARYK